MKKYILCSLLIIWGCVVSAQDSYFVTVIKGAVTKIDGSALKTGAKITLAEKLVFPNKESLVILLHPAKGRYIVSPAKATASKGNKFILLVKDYLQIHAENVRLSSRAIDDDIRSLADQLKTNPSINERILIIDSLKIPYKEKQFSDADNEENFFFLQLVAPKPVSRKLASLNNLLIITKDDIVFDDKIYSKEAGKLNLGYMEGYSSSKNASLVTALEPAFITREECMDIIKSIKRSMPGKPGKDILKEIYTQLYFLFGKPDEKAIEQLYQQIK